MAKTAEEIAAAADKATKATADAAQAIIDQRAAEKAEADRVKADKLAADQADADKTAAALAPYVATLDVLTATGRITVAERKGYEAAIVQGKTADLLLLKAADNPVGNKEKTGAQTGGRSANPTADWAEKTYGKQE